MAEDNPLDLDAIEAKFEKDADMPDGDWLAGWAMKYGPALIEEVRRLRLREMDLPRVTDNGWPYCPRCKSSEKISRVSDRFMCNWCGYYTPDKPHWDYVKPDVDTPPPPAMGRDYGFTDAEPGESRGVFQFFDKRKHVK